MATSEEPVCIVGAGGWGTALAILLARDTDRVHLWSYEPDHARDLASSRVNDAYLPGVVLPDNILPTSDLTVVSESRTIVMVTPSRGVRETAARMAGIGLRDDATLVTCTKGIEFESGLRMSQILAEELPGRPVAALSGPSHAEEVARGIPAAVVVASSDAGLATSCQHRFSTANFRIYTSGDIAGVELGGALKNVFALAAGISDGLGLGDNSKAALVTRSLAELTRLGTALGGQPETFQGLSGIGDLMVTCFSRHSRNRGFGERLGRGESVEEIRQSMKMVAEGVPTARSAFDRARKLGVTTPVIDVVHAILEGLQNPREAMQSLMARELKAE